MKTTHNLARFLPFGMDLATAATFLCLLRVVESQPITPILLLRAETTPAGSSTSYRTRYDIVSSCIFTIIACVWTSGHPNIAAPQDSGWKTLKRRAVTMVYALIAPEAVIMWALRQHIAAGRIANDYNTAFMPSEALPSQRSIWTDPIGCTKEWFTDLTDNQVSRREGQPWTKTHGLFVQMGGFMLYHDGLPVRVLSFKDFKGLLHAKMIDEPLVTERELKDRTKGDTLSKALVVVQTTWFVFQCAARQCVGLPLTELEVITLGFAVLNAVLYAVWWNKPQSVEVGIAISLKTDFLEQTADEPKGADVDQEESLLNNRSTDDFQETEPVSQSHHGHMGSNTLYRGVSALFRPLKEMLSCRKIPEGAQRVPDFYADDKGLKESGRACTIACIVGTAFGALHIWAWTSAFPSQSELVLWRLSTVIITAEPVFMLLVGVLYEEKVTATSSLLHAPSLSSPGVPQQGQPRRMLSCVKTALQQTFIILFALGTPLYILARLTLIVLAFISLRSLPLNAFQVVSWTSFIPHL